MKLSEIVAAAATLLGREEINEYLSDTTTENVSATTLAEVDTMTRLANLVLNELAGSYIPMVCTEKVTPVNGRVYYSELDRKILKIRGVYDDYGRKLFFVVHPEYLHARGEADSVEYEYLPDNLGLTEETGYLDKDVSVSVLAYGLAAEVCLSENRFDEAVMWRKRYSDGVASFALPESAVMKSRCWL